MQQTQAVWLLTVLSILTAGLPFVVQRPLVLWPWTTGFFSDRGRRAAVWLRILISLLHLVLLAGWGALAVGWIGHSLATSAWSIAARLLGMLALLALLLGWPAVAANPAAHQPFNKPFLSRLLEWLALYGLMLTLGFALEAQLGNPYAQGWPFYAITLSLYLILAFPAFVWRYLFKR